MAVFSIPSFMAIASAVLKPMPRISRASRYGFSVMTWTGIRTVGLVNADCPCSTNPMAVQEDHDLAHDLLLSPGIGDAFGADRANTRHLTQAIRLSLDRVKHL